jgi:hypothetical protein
VTTLIATSQSSLRVIHVAVFNLHHPPCWEPLLALEASTCRSGELMMLY